MNDAKKKKNQQKKVGYKKAILLIMRWLQIKF